MSQATQPDISTNTPAASRLHRKGDRGLFIPIQVSPPPQTFCSSTKLDVSSTQNAVQPKPLQRMNVSGSPSTLWRFLISFQYDLPGFNARIRTYVVRVLVHHPDGARLDAKDKCAVGCRAQPRAIVGTLPKAATKAADVFSLALPPNVPRIFRSFDDGPR